MRNTTNICLTCLSTDRRLVPLHTIATVIQEINFIELKVSTNGICWECWSIMVKFQKFKYKAQTAQTSLQLSKEQDNLKPLTTLTSNTNLLYNYQYIYTFDPLTNCDNEPKLEPDTIKQEIFNTSDDNIENTSDIDEKNCEVAISIEENIAEDNESKHNKNLLEKGINNDGDYIKNNFTGVLTEKEMINTKSDIDENFTTVTENIENVYIETFETKHKNCEKVNKSKRKVKNKSNKNLIRKVENITKSDEDEINEKFLKVIRTEEDMRRNREEKRNHYNFKKLPYKCDSCVLGFMRKENYNTHIEKKHNESIGHHICDVCSVRFSSKYFVDRHRKKHYVYYRCRLCKYKAHAFSSALNHCTLKHIGDWPDNIHCSKCDTVVKTPEELEQHIQSEHTLYCNECGVRFKGMNTLKIHVARIHAVKRDFICDICTKTFKTKTRLESHMVSHNSSIAKKLAYCHMCNIQYKNIYVYRNHLKYSTNHSERTYPCSECNKKFTSKVYWKKHYNFYHLQKSQFNCEICNKLFISDWRLKNHKQKHHGLNRSRDHTCSVCGKKFFTRATLRGHQLTHSEQRSYMCEDCGDTFKQRPALYTHTRLVHRGVGRRK